MLGVGASRDSRATELAVVKSSLKQRNTDEPIPMSIFAFLLILLAALLHASWNLAVKSSGGGKMLSFYSALTVMLFWGPVNFGLWTFSPESSPTEWNSLAWMVVGASAVVHALYIACLFHGYEVAPLSVVYPIARGTAPLLSACAALFLFSENLTVSSAFGIAAITGGVVCLSWKGRVVEEERDRITKGLFWGGLTGMTIALYTLLDGYAVKTLGLNPLSVDYLANVLRAPLLVPFVLRTRAAELTKAHWRAILAITIFGPAAYILVMFAMRLAPLSHVAPARELSLLIGVFFSGHFLKEEERNKRLAAALLIAVGVLLLTASR